MRVGAWYLGNDQCEFTLWAPKAESATVHIVSPKPRRLDMRPHDRGYWTVTASDIPPGTRYLLQIDQQEAKPDPASQSQPEGVHAPSEVIDHRFEWKNAATAGVPLEDMIIYELHVGTFTPEGTFDAIAPRLSRLHELGVNAIEIMPVNQCPGEQPTRDPKAYRNWGYDGVYPFAVQNSYGGVTGLKQLVDASHQQGIAVILDVVYNHFGPEGNYLNVFAPYFTETYRTPWGSAVNFDDAYSDGVRNYFIENALYWLREFQIDGLRLDAIHAIYDLGAKHFLQELSDRVDQLSQQHNRKCVLIAESALNDARIIRPVEKGGYAIDAQWSDDFHHALHTLITGESLEYYEDFGRCEDLAKAYRDRFVQDGCYSQYRRRNHGNTATDCPPHQFVVCIQNHDQIGNRLLGERISQLVSFEALKLAAGAVLLSPYVPLLFMGEEYGEEAPFAYFVSHSDPDLIQAIRKGRKEEFAAFHALGEPPDAESPETFLMCKLNWEKHQEGKHQTLWTFYQHLIQLRRTFPALKNSNSSIDAGADEAQKIVWWRREADGNQLLCVLNFSQQDSEFQFPAGQWRKVLDSADEKWLGNGAALPEQVASGGSGKVRSQSIALFEMA